MTEACKIISGKEKTKREQVHHCVSQQEPKASDEVITWRFPHKEEEPQHTTQAGEGGRRQYHKLTFAQRLSQVFKRKYPVVHLESLSLEPPPWFRRTQSCESAGSTGGKRQLPPTLLFPGTHCWQHPTGTFPYLCQIIRNKLFPARK